MKKLVGTFLVFIMLALPFVSAVGVGGNIPITITPEQFAPRVFISPHTRVVVDDFNEPGAMPPGVNGEMTERIENYAFEGEQIIWNVLVWDKNGRDKISDVFVTLSQQSDFGEPIIEERTIEYCDSLPYRSGVWTDDLELPLFDPSLGELQSVDLDFSTYIAATFGVENIVPEQGADFTAYFMGQIDLLTPDGQPLESSIDWSQSGYLEAHDGLIDYTGPSGVFYDNILDEATLTHSPAVFAAYQGVGVMLIPVSTTASSSVVGPGDFNTQVRTNLTASACVEYTYLVETQTPGTMESEIEANCYSIPPPEGENGLGDLYEMIYEGEEMITWDPGTMQWYTCAFTVETSASMQGEYVIVAGAEDLNGLYGESAETEYWFLNPVIALGISGSINFGTVRPGATVKSTSLRITNNAEEGSGVLLDMYIAGTDFYDPSHSAAMCPTSNVLRLTQFSYYAALGAYNTCTHSAGADTECYVSIPYYVTGAGDTGNNNMQRIIDGPVKFWGVYPTGNVLSPGADMSINFKLAVPEPCNGGSFSQGTFKIFGEAI